MNQRLPVWRHINIGTFDHQLSASIVDFELLTIVESQMLRASEVQYRYNRPHFDVKGTDLIHNFQLSIHNSQFIIHNSSYAGHAESLFTTEDTEGAELFRHTKEIS